VSALFGPAQTHCCASATNKNGILHEPSTRTKYTYDAFNRLVGSNENSGQAVYSYVYDRFGNRWQQNGPNSMILAFTGNNPSNPQNNNRMDGYSYDTAGNLLNDGTHSYAYDAEDRITQVDGGSTSSYVYDAEGRRVRKTVGSSSVDYLYDLAGQQIVEVSSSGGWNRGEVYAGGRHVATYANNTTYFIHSDWLGTERARVTSTGNPYEVCTSLPFGDALSCSAADPSPMHFTGKQHDTETGLDNFGARYNSSQFGRFMTPDWSAKVEPVPYAKLDDPQTLNLYQYMRNNPLGGVDIDGHDALWVIDKDTGQVTLVIPVHFTGSAATQPNISAILKQDNSLDTGGSPVRIKVISTDKPIDGVLNHMDFSPGYNTKLCGSAGECVNKLGGNEAHINSANGQSTGAAAHDVLHFAGIKDEYIEGPRDKSGNRTSKPAPGYDNSNIMTARTGTKLNPRQIQEANRNKTTKHCITGGTAPCPNTAPNNHH
jgi:RHS repeat-associated protein